VEGLMTLVNDPLSLLWSEPGPMQIVVDCELVHLLTLCLVDVLVECPFKLIITCLVGDCLYHAFRLMTCH